jgi:(1->4)-alpha-D-glucan 1-alpha-D-glucosylmutase
MHAGFTFADAGEVVPYLADLGVSHLYLSPVLTAVAGSAHGYDVVDHDRVNPELGGREGLEALAATARDHGLGIVVDVVPNHMAFVAPEHANAPLWQLLAEGPTSSVASWFDVDWDALDGRIGLPILGDPLADVLARGELTLDTHEGRPVVRYFDHVLPLAAGTGPDESDGGSGGGSDVAAVLARQHYLLAGWREKDEVLNYRRFFDVDGLIAVRVEEPEVFEATHRLLLDLNHRGIVEGFRIDHPDGLADPEGYLRELRAASRLGTAIWVEKILEGEEELPTDWPCEGTTGYDAMRAITAALVDTGAAEPLSRAWAATGGEPALETVVTAAKREVVDRLLGPERHRLTRRATEALPDLDPARLAQAVTALLVAADVYRAYARPGRAADAAATAVLDGAAERAREDRPDLAVEIDALLRIATRPAGGSDAQRDFAVRLQQTWGPVMAKAIEDTSFYRWHRLVALNEVGGDPELLETGSPEVLHAWAQRQQQRWPLGLTTLSTHDTKRSEDVRARLIALAGDAGSWTTISEAFAAAADEHGVDGPTAHLVWQTLAGVGEISDERLEGYLEKALREAKQQTTWTEPDTDYEQRVLALARAATRPGPLKALLDTAVDHNAAATRAVVLGQKLLQLTMPGAPDTYQGCEVVDLSLVDPDNRRPVDFEARHARLRRLADGPAADLDDEKLLVTTRSLALRRRHRDSFGDNGSYAPVGATSRHVVGFTRGSEVAVLATRAPQRLEAAGGWADHTVDLPEGLWRDELTDTLHEGGTLVCRELFATMPVALLQRVHT